MIETTIHLNEKVYESICLASKELHLSNSRVIIMLINRFIVKNKKFGRHYSRIRYQKINKETDRCILHVYFPEDFYERCIDMRKLYKMSVSFIVAIAVSDFYSNIDFGKRLDFDTDNYPSCYICIVNYNVSIFSYTVFWQMPTMENLMIALE